MTRSTPRLIAAATFAVLLGGCSMLGVRSDYEQARETRPLEIPPELDAPAQSGTMRVPEVAGAPAAGASAPVGVPSAIPAGEATSLAIADGVGGAWRRVGLALERSGVAEVSARDEAAGTYTVSGTTTLDKPAEGGFFKRMFSRDEARSAQVTRVVRIVADGAGSVVRVEDEQGQPADDELARRVIEAIRQRLG
jgi:uncharacterized lipoprotein